MTDQPSEATRLALLVGTGAVAALVVADLLDVVSLSGNLLPVLLAALLLPWAAVNLRRGDRLMAAGLGLAGLGNLAALGPTTVRGLGALGFLLGAALVVASALGVGR